MNLEGIVVAMGAVIILHVLRNHCVKLFDKNTVFVARHFTFSGKISRKDFRIYNLSPNKIRYLPIRNS